jgi:hypothetical protein
VKLSSGPFRQHTLSRFRLSVTNRPFPLFEPSLMRIKADRERNGLVRLGAACGLDGDWASAVAVLERAAVRPEGSALDSFLLALARHHPGLTGPAAIAIAPASGCEMKRPTTRPATLPSRR